MPPEVSSCYSLVIPSLPPLSQKSELKQTRYHKCCQETLKLKMAIRKKLILVLVFILSIASIFRLLKISIVTTISSPSIYECSSLFPICRNNSSYPLLKNQSFSLPNDDILSRKEMNFLSDLISERSPCNLLVFGLESQYSTIAALNEGGITIFLEDNLEKISKTKLSNNSRVYKVEYETLARDAYKLLKHGRKNQDCSPKNDVLEKSRCKLALTKLPDEVYKLKWDIVVVDGPCGDKPECPGRMAAIYTASVLARKGNTTTHVIVHDIDRLIEKWFSWEFLCEENLVSSKGKFWNFRIVGQYNSTAFCPV